ncbi:MAG: hypothetical protein HY423_07940 [Candidatus Lambdaproteobacteria bacterium]|nr:hypothetical protein [Candidatus Lambdaproteobacteria bacterium]
MRVAKREPDFGMARAAEALIDYYIEQGLTDGLPIVPPSRESIEAMLAGAKLRWGDLVAMMSARHTPIMADKVAINAVMAGCRPEYMPVVCAAVRALADARFNGHGPVTTTSSTALAIVVNGPIARRLGIAAKDNAFGPGFRPNATIGRALRLILMNVLNCRPGALDRSQLGNAAKYSFCFAENEEDSPWEPLHTERGFTREQSALTLFAAISHITTNNQLTSDPEQVSRTLGDGISYLGSHNILGQGELMVVLGRELTQHYHNAGWSKAQIKEGIYRNAKRSIADLKAAGRIAKPPEPGDETRWRYPVRRPEDILVVIAGGSVGNHGVCLTGWGLHNPTRSVTVAIEG